MQMQYWLLKLICPKCKKEVSKNSHKCPYCGERFPFPLKVPPQCLKSKETLEKYVHEKIFPKLSIWQREYLAQYFTVIFQDGFESGDFSAWTDIVGSPTVVTTAPHHGTYHLRSNPVAWAEAYAYKILTSGGYTTFFIRWYFRVGTLPASGQLLTLGKMQNSGWSDVWSVGIYNNAGTLQLALRRRFPSDVWSYYNFAFQTNRYYCVEVKFVKASGTGGEYRAYLDGTERITMTGLDTSGAGTVGIFYVGSYPEYNYPNVYADCVVIGDSYIGEEVAPPPMPTHTLTVNSTPIQGVPFTIEKVS